MKAQKWARALVVLLCLSALLAAPAAAQAAVELNPYEQQLVDLVNRTRARHDLKPLRVRGCLVAAARAHSLDMAANQFLAHRSSDGTTWVERLVAFGYVQEGFSYWRAGENVYAGGGLFSSPVAVVQAWMKSKAHRRVLLTKAFRDVGVGAVECEDGYGDCPGPVWFFTLDTGRRIR
jgi:uncharacterized protein YkwD